MYDLGRILSTLRKKKGYTQAQAATRLGVNRSTIVSWENNYREPNFQNLVDVSRLYDAPVTYLLGIEKGQCVNIGALTKRQQDIITNLIAEFNTPHKGSAILSPQQYTLLNNILGEFYEKGIQ